VSPTIITHAKKNDLQQHKQWQTVWPQEQDSLAVWRKHK